MVEIINSNKTHTNVSNVAYLSQVRIRVEATLVADSGFTLGTSVVVRYSRWVGQLCGGAHGAQLAAWHRRNLRHWVWWGGCHAAVRRRGWRPTASCTAEVDLEVSAGGVLTGTSSMSVTPHAWPRWTVTVARSRALPHTWGLAWLCASRGNWTLMSGQTVGLPSSGSYPSTTAHACSHSSSSNASHASSSYTCHSSHPTSTYASNSSLLHAWFWTTHQTRWTPEKRKRNRLLWNYWEKSKIYKDWVLS